jgi:hypothetical protein
VQRFSREGPSFLGFYASSEAAENVGSRHTGGGEELGSNLVMETVLKSSAPLRRTRRRRALAAPSCGVERHLELRRPIAIGRRNDALVVLDQVEVGRDETIDAGQMRQKCCICPGAAVRIPV